MNILNIGSNFSNIVSVKNENNINYVKQNLMRDIVAFSGKNYSFENITNPTNHCGYCGCKVYTKSQLESIAQEILASKSQRLQGKIKSILEKLEGAKYSEEIAYAKRLENSDEIDFFKNLSGISSKKSFLTGESIFEQIYRKNADEAIEILMKNMHPLMRTIDHISPKNRNETNNNSDINLLEACYCCNHNLKKGVSFSEFYEMFPSISKNMPEEKFNYALSNALQNSKDGVSKRLSSVNLLKSLKRLLIQREETINTLNSINYRISLLKHQIEDTIENLNREIEIKQVEIVKLEELENETEVHNKIQGLKTDIDILEQTIKDLEIQKNSI